MLRFVFHYGGLLLLGIVVLHFISVVLAIVSERREPSATVAWLMTVTFLPVVGVILYYALARTRFRRQFRKREEKLGQAEEALSFYVQQQVADFDRALEGLRPEEQGLIQLAANSAASPGGGAPFVGNAVERYADGAAKFEALMAAIRSARSHIHLEYYIVRPDETGTAVRDLLVEKAKAGVEVRFLYDGIGSLGLHRRGFFGELVEAGGEVEAFLPLRISKILERVNFRNHRKIAVIDGRVGFLGGMNIGDEYAGRRPEYGGWRDSHLRIEGPAVAELQHVFLTDWLFTTNQTVADPQYFPDIEAAGDELVQIVASGPGCRWPTIQHLFFQAINTAERQVLIVTPYFVPDRSVLMALESAALRGLDVRLLLPSRTDHRMVTSAARSYYEELLESGVRIFEYQTGYLHSKTISVDGRYGSVGSANMDVRSFTLNFEASAFVYSARFAEGLRRQFLEDSDRAEEIELERFRGRPRIKRFGQSLAQLLSPVL
ncbi:MAG: cardiolipin synthase [Planctomycetota bacterium]